MELIRTAWRNVRRSGLWAIEWAGDRRWGITTTAPYDASLHDPEAESIGYEPLNYRALRMLGQRLTLSRADRFVDIGCGMGRVVCWAAKQRVAWAAGVELDPELAEVASRNLKGEGRSAVFCMDAADFGYDAVTVAFMYNPFGAGPMRKVLAKLCAIPDLRVVYANPVQQAVFAEFPRLTKEEVFFAPYDLGRVEVQIWRVGSDGQSA
jgi:SAM-dependent methyltransferase